MLYIINVKYTPKQKAVSQNSVILIYNFLFCDLPFKINTSLCTHVTILIHNWLSLAALMHFPGWTITQKYYNLWNSNINYNTTPLKILGKVNRFKSL